ncbi:hypothetical protein V6615_01995 [Oscillospiraceae bacterium PP1C4]
MGYAIPIIMIIASNVFYNLFTKTMPAHTNPFAGLVVAYLSAAAVTFTLLLFNVQIKGLAAAFQSVNWTSIALGASLVFLELGYIQAYRMGWNISVCSLVANIGLAVILLAVGILFFKERLSPNQIIGIALCMVGLFFVNKR